MQNSANPSPGLSIPSLMTAEVLAAVSASAMVSPFISIIDKSIIANASGKQPLWEGITLGLKTFVTRPVHFVKQPQFVLIWIVYAGTYIVGNTIDAVCQYRNKAAFYPKFIGSSVANVSLSVWKDRLFTRMFGQGKPRALPYPSYGLFATRDSLTILAGFSLPPIVSEQLQATFSILPKTADIVSQLTVPCAMQFFSCPMHLMGIDLYNRSQQEVNVSRVSRWQFIQREYWKTAFARVGRIFPAYGIGGVVNKQFRMDFKGFMVSLENRFIPSSPTPANMSRLA